MQWSQGKGKEESEMLLLRLRELLLQWVVMGMLVIDVCRKRAVTTFRRQENHTTMFAL